MSEQFQGKILAMAALAALIGMDGFFSLIDRKIRGAGNESAIHAQSNPTENIVMNMPKITPKSICTQSDLLIDEEAPPLMDEEFERIEWNEDQEEILRNASNTAFDQDTVLASLTSITNTSIIYRILTQTA